MRGVSYGSIIIPNDGVSFDMNGNVITIRSLDLSGDFENNTSQINEIAERYIK